MSRAGRFFLALMAAGASLTVFGQELFEGGSGVPLVEVDRIYVKGLQFLAKTQSAGGSWADSPQNGAPAITALATVSMLAHGDDPNAGPYSVNIRRGLDYVLKDMDPETGYMGPSMYNHGFCTLCLAEAFGMVDDSRIGPALVKAVRLIVDAQNRNSHGAWRYSPEAADADTTVSGAQMVALFAARNAGIAVSDETIKKALDYFKSCQLSDGGIGYLTAQGAGNQTRTAIASVVFALAKERSSETYTWASNYLTGNPLNDMGGQYGAYILYYSAQAYFRISPEAWRTWNTRNFNNLKATQNSDGSWAGGGFGLTFNTAGSLLSLALNYRFLPIYER